MPPKRSYNKTTRKTYRKYGGKAKVKPAMTTLQAAVKRAVAQSINKNIETKQSCYSNTDGQEILHNNFITLNNTLLYTSQGVTAPDTLSTNNRIGDKINLKGVSIKFMAELNERYSDVTFRCLVVRCARGDTPTRATLFNGLSGNKMLDTINRERYSILHDKWFKIKAPNNGALGALGAGGIGSGINASGTGVDQIPLSRATKIIKIWISGTKFNKSGIITYEDGGNAVKFFDYHVLLYAYSNYSTDQDLYYVGRLNDVITQMYYKDA